MTTESRANIVENKQTAQKMWSVFSLQFGRECGIMEVVQVGLVWLGR